MKTHHPTTQRPSGMRRADRAAPHAAAYEAEAAAPSAAQSSLETLRDPAAPAPVRAASAVGMQSVLGNAAVARELARQEAVAPLAAQVDADDLAEFDLLKHKITDGSAAEYVRHRDQVFGGAAAYRVYAAVADAELNESKKLHRRIELAKTPDAQRIFYRWVRKAYENAGVTDVPALILRGSTDELKEALAAVKEGYGKDFKSGGFNPRPKKSPQYRYRLGTISEHALGTAVDIEAAHNPILSLTDWKFVENIAGKVVDRRLARWKTEPEALWTDVNELNTLFVTNIAQEIERVANEQKNVADSDNSVKKSKQPRRRAKQPIDIVFGKNRGLKKWATGFFTLEWSLVEQLHAQGFRWGLTFSTSIDLHHFELSD